MSETRLENDMAIVGRNQIDQGGGKGQGMFMGRVQDVVSHQDRLDREVCRNLQVYGFLGFVGEEKE